MKRYYLIPMYETVDGWINRAQDPAYGFLQFEFGAVPSDPGTGMPVFGWSLVLCDVQAQGEILNDPLIYALPIVPYTRKLSDMPVTQVNTMFAGFDKFGIDKAPINGQSDLGDIVDYLGQQLDPLFDHTSYPL